MAEGGCIWFAIEKVALNTWSSLEGRRIESSRAQDVLVNTEESFVGEVLKMDQVLMRKTGYMSLRNDI